LRVREPKEVEMATRMDDARVEMSSARQPGMAWRVWILVGTGVLAIAITIATKRVSQSQAYFGFADQRTLLSIPNALNVLSNSVFALVGSVGLLGLASDWFPFRDARERWPWAVFFAGVALTSVGSAWFHLGPNNDSLVWDRLPMAVGFMGLLAALVAERIDPSAGLRLLGPLVLAGVGSVFFWIATERAGVGDLRPYFLVQFYPLACILLVLLLFPPSYTGTSGWVLGLAAYAAAKWAESADGAIFATLGLVSGHTVKHLLAAGGIAVLLAMLRYRRPIPSPEAVPP
jgi:hypothetical protein